MNKRVLFLTACIAALILIAGAARAESLDDILGVGKTDARESSAETKKLWENLLAALEKNDAQAAAVLAKQFSEVHDVTEPCQKTFALSVQEISASNASATAAIPKSAKQQEVERQIGDRRADITGQQQLIEGNNALVVQKNKDLDDAQAKLGALQKAARDKAKTSGTAGAFSGLGGLAGAGSAIAGNVTRADAQAAATDVNNCKGKIAALQTDIANLGIQNTAAKDDIRKLESDVSMLLSTQRDLLNQQVEQEKQQQSQQFNALRDRTVSALMQIRDSGSYRAAIALANLFISRVCPDPQISQVAQDCIDAQKAEAKAAKIIDAASKPVSDLLAANRLWSAKSELDRATDLINQRVTDPIQRKFVNRDLSRVSADLDKRMKRADKELATVFEAAKRDAIDGQKRLDSYSKQYPDYPNLEQDKIKVGDLRAQQVQAKFDKKLAAIQEVIANDPAEAKAMIKKLMESEIDPDEVSIMSSRIVALKRSILDKEVAAIQKEMDEAQSYLTSFKATYSVDLKSDFKGETVTASQTQQLSTGVENLVRARSVQAGAIKRLEMLITEETDNVTKSKLVGLLETQKAAVAQMDDSINASKGSLERANARLDGQAQNARLLIIGGIVLGLVVLGALVVVVLKHKAPKVA